MSTILLFHYLNTRAKTFVLIVPILIIIEITKTDPIKINIIQHQNSVKGKAL